MQDYIIGILIAIAIANCISFILMRFIWQSAERLGAELVQHVGDPDSKTMDYFIAGNLNQPEAAFEFMRDETGDNYTYANYCPMGWDVFTTATEIAEDILEHKYQARIFTISVGDHVARYLENLGNLDIKVYAINPCPNGRTLRRPLAILLTIAAPLFSLVCHGLGWISIIPLIPTVGGKYSLMLLADQYTTIAYDLPSLQTKKTAGVILSKNDELLNNDAIRPMFGDDKIVTIDSSHGNTVGAGLEYLRGMRDLLGN